MLTVMMPPTGAARLLLGIGAPAVPQIPLWMCWAFAVTPLIATVPVSLLLLKLSVAAPVAVEAFGGVSCLPFSVALKATGAALARLDTRRRATALPRAREVFMTLMLYVSRRPGKPREAP